MATKLSNFHLTQIMLESKNYYALDTYISLAHISSEVHGKFLIQTYSSNKSELVNIVKQYTPISYKTIFNNLNELIELNILSFNAELSSWVLVGMEKMVLSKSLASHEDKDQLKGFTVIRDFFLSDEFSKMRPIEKRCLVYLSQLKDSKASASYSDFKMNLNKSHSSWMKILKTTCKYYARNAIDTMLNKYKNIFIDTSKNYRSISNPSKRFNRFLFSFTCDAIKKVDKTDTQYKLLSIHNPAELELVNERIAWANIKLSKANIIHLVRSIATISDWRLKEQVVGIIVNKYIAIQIHNSREEIRSLPSYLVTVVKDVLQKSKEFKKHCSEVFNNIDNTVSSYFTSPTSYTTSVIQSIEEMIALI